MNTQLTSSPQTVLAELRSAVRGTVIAPTDDRYDETRRLFPGDVDLRPSVIVRVVDAADVAGVIGVARRTGLELAVRSGGHNTAGHGSTDGGIVIDLRDMKAIDIDVAGRTAWVETGATAAEVTNATGEHGLAVGFGDTGSVGVGGITLGGGIGYLVRKHGLTIDSLLAAEVVTADGSILHVDAESHPDLFWAIRGGGGNFGVATRFRFRLRALPGIVGGILILPATPHTIAGFMAAAAAAPDELSAIANVMPAPPMPFLPEDTVGKVVVFALMTYAGDAEAGERALAPFRALATPLADLLRPMPYAEMYPPEDESYRPLAISRTMFMDTVDGDTAATMLEHLEASDAPLRVVQLRALGGAIARVPADATAFAHRASRVMANVASFYTGPDDKPLRAGWVASLSAALQQGDDGAYVNFLVDEGEERIRAAYPGATWDRLVEVKRRYDPTNLFRRNQNIAPA